MRTIRAFRAFSALGLLLLTQASVAQDFSNASFSGCYVYSFYGNILGPEITVDPATGQPVLNEQKLVLHGTSFVGRACSNGDGSFSEMTGTENVAGLCIASYSGAGTYDIAADGTGTITASLEILADPPTTPGCADLGVKAGDTQTFEISFALEGEQACLKMIGKSFAITSADDPQAPPTVIPVVTEAEACPQVQPESAPQ